MNLTTLRARLRDPRVQAGLLGAALVVAVGAAYAFGTAGEAPATPPEAAESPAPTAANVDPTVHARLMTLRREVDAAPADTARLLALARMEHDAHQFEAAVGTFERLIAVAPGHRQAYLDLAQAHAALGAWPQAQAAMERLLARYPTDPSGLYNLGAILANQGDYAAARPYWTRVAGQTADAELARQARSSLVELERLAAAGAPAPGTTAPGGAAPPLPPDAAGGPLPAGHPPIPGGAAPGGLETSVLTGPPLPAGTPLPAPPSR